MPLFFYHFFYQNHTFFDFFFLIPLSHIILYNSAFLAHFLANLHSSFGSDFPRFERHNEVLRKDGAYCQCLLL